MIPVVRDAGSAAFFDGTERGELLLRTCPDGHWSEPSAACCTTCGTTDLAWSAAAGTGTLASWAVVHGRDGVRRVVAVVELDEGPWWWTSLVDVEEPVGGMAVAVRFTPRTEESEAVPYFVARLSS